MSVAASPSEGKSMFTSTGNQSRCVLQTTSIIPSYALGCIGSALQSRTRPIHSDHSSINVSSALTPHSPVPLSSPANPAFSAEELQYQLEATGAKLLFVHPFSLQVGLAAARAIGLSDDKVVLIEPALNSTQHFVTLDEVISEGLKHPERFMDRKFEPGEAKTKIAVGISRFDYVERI